MEHDFATTTIRRHFASVTALFADTVPGRCTPFHDYLTHKALRQILNLLTQREWDAVRRVALTFLSQDRGNC